jgi:prevent-host-death family protein
MIYISTFSRSPEAMPIVSMRQYNQDSSGVARAASKAPVFVTNRGKPTHVVMSIEEYERIQGRPKSILDTLRQPGGPEYDFEFEPPRLGGELIRPLDFE